MGNLRRVVALVKIIALSFEDLDYSRQGSVGKQTALGYFCYVR